MNIPAWLADKSFWFYLVIFFGLLALPLGLYLAASASAISLVWALMALIAAVHILILLVG